MNVSEKDFWSRFGTRKPHQKATNIELTRLILKSYSGMNIPALLSFPSSSTSTILPLDCVWNHFFRCCSFFSPGKKELISIFYFIPLP